MDTKWNNMTTMKISPNTQKLLKIIKSEYQKHYRRNITFNDIILQLLVGGIDDRINSIISECI